MPFDPRPIRLRPDNFTPPSRTPWGGTRIVRQYKAALELGGLAPDTRVGESWELSTCDEFHTLTAEGELLGRWLGRDPEGALGAEASLGRRSTALLVKWIDAADNLSLQIHPDDDYPALGPDETGKLEAWYVVDREPGAGIYLGFRPGVGEREVRAALAGDADLSELMAFSEVERGDFVLLECGTPHALGRGVALIEPQRVAPGKRGVTYRYWDFGRRYDAQGRLDAAGTPRELHVAHALAVTRWDRVADPAWLATRRQRHGWPALDGAARCELLCTPEPAGPNAARAAHLRVARVLGNGSLRLPAWNALRSLTVIEGSVALGAAGDALHLRAGETAALPAASGALEVTLDAAHAVVCAATG
jgi:mannose-6-phosphate isomerase